MIYGGLRPRRVSHDGTAVGVVDYGMGNRRSVEKALEHVGARVTVSAQTETLATCDALVVPGVGAFPRAMERVRALGLDSFLIERAAAGVPILGICLGMQLFFERSTEHGGADGLGIVPGEVVELDTAHRLEHCQLAGRRATARRGRAQRPVLPRAQLRLPAQLRGGRIGRSRVRAKLRDRCRP